MAGLLKITSMIAQRFKAVLPTGLALFAMLFGSGNLMFPLVTGQKAMSAYPWGILGFMLSSVIMSFIGHVGVMRCKGNPQCYFGELPSWIYWFIATVVFCIVGPFYVIPRCALTALGGVKEVYPFVSTAMFSFFFCTVSFVLAIKEDMVINILGKYLTPLKLGGVLFVIFGALYVLPHDILPSVDAWYAVVEGIKDGYQPMDLLGTIFFSTMIYKFLENQLKKDGNTTPNELYKRSIMAGVIGFACVAAIYLLLLFLGAKYSLQTVGLEKSMILPRITSIALGRYAAMLIAFVLFFSTLATAVALFNVFTNFFVTDVLKNRISRMTGLLFTFIVSYAISLIGLDAIINFAGTYILSWLYPCIMTFVAFKFVKLQFTKA